MQSTSLARAIMAQPHQRTTMAAILGVAIGALALGAQAQVLVQDTTTEQSVQNIESKLGDFKSANHDDIKNNHKDLDNIYQQLRTTLQIKNNNISKSNNNLQQLSVSQLQNAKCAGSAQTPGNAPPSSDTPASGAPQTIASSLSGSFVQAQQQICRQIVSIEVDKYNRTTKMLSRINDYTQLASDTEQQRSQIVQSDKNENADMLANTNQALRNLANLNTEIANWRAMMEADDAAIQALQQAQSSVAQTAMNGTQSTSGQLQQTIALQSALQLIQ